MHTNVIQLQHNSEVIEMERMETVQARITKETKEKAVSILNSLGLNMSTYINMALNQLVIQNGVPFDLKLEIPNAETLAAFEEGDRIANDPNAPKFDSVDELFKELNS